MLHGAGDTSADGGSPFQTPQKARSFEAALRKAGKTVEAVYYENAGHNGIFTDPKQFDDSVRRIARSLRSRQKLVDEPVVVRVRLDVVVAGLREHVNLLRSCPDLK